MRNPFVGLRPFRTAENDLFFGRARDIAVLQNLVLALPVLVVYAPSGTGKSSLLNAGLLPAVERDATLLPIVVVDPHDDVWQRVRRELASTGWVDETEPGDGSGGLAQTLERHFSATDRRVILVLDQFEERLKQSAALETLYAEIARLANTSSDAATVVISIREDYLAGLEKLMRRVTGLLDASYRVPSLSRSALTEAVRGPLGAVGADVTIDGGLVDEVLTDLERETRLAETLDGRIEAGYFQIVWSHLWEKDVKGPGDRLTRETYLHEGRATGILESFVSETLSQLLPFDAEILRAAIRYLVLPTGAKVALTVDDLVGLLRPEDFTEEGRRLLPIYDEIYDEQTIRSTLDTVLQQLTRTDAPLFRRAVRGGREEFELVHDLLGPILVQWRLEYEVAQRTAATQVVSEVFGLGGRERELAMSQIARLAEKSAPHRQLRGAEEGLALYSRNLRTAETSDEARKNGQLLRSVFAYVLDSARTTSDMFMTEELQRKLRNAQTELSGAAFHHHSRDVRRVLQRQAYEFLALRERLDRSGWSPSDGIRGWRLLLRNSVAWVVGVALAIAGLAAARWVVGLAWHVPHVEYFPLTLGVIAVGAGFLYTFMYGDEAKDSPVDWDAARQALWPFSRLSAQVPTQGREESVFLEEPIARPSSSPLQYAVILIWWPFHYLLLELACFAGAALFELAGWSPTAGFNLAALISAIGLTFCYFLAWDY